MRIYAVTIRSIGETYVVASHSVRGAISRAIFQSYLLSDTSTRRVSYSVRLATIEQVKQFKKDFPYANISNEYLYV